VAERAARERAPEAAGAPEPGTRRRRRRGGGRARPAPEAA
jgi:hypothetical protein